MPTTRKPSPPVTEAMAAHIRFLVQKQGLYQHQAAALVGVNPGRVNEVIKGHRFPEEPSAQGSFPF
jgi:predicted XRE-type DNA-binding protein